jgi:hypothetical protein
MLTSISRCSQTSALVGSNNLCMSIEKIKDTISLAGSVASITGISLLWLKGFYSSINLLVAVPAFAIASLVAVGCAAVSFLLFSQGYTMLAQSRHFIGKLIYVCFAGAIAILLLSVAWYFIFLLAWVAIRDSSHPS